MHVVVNEAYTMNIVQEISVTEQDLKAGGWKCIVGWNAFISSFGLISASSYKIYYVLIIDRKIKR